MAKTSFYLNHMTDQDPPIWSATILEHRQNMTGGESILHLESETFDDPAIMLVWLEDRIDDLT